MLSKLARSFARIMFYRGIRTLLSNISNAFREGAKNVALYSKALNGLDSNNANGVMSELATTGLYLKNSFGAAVIPILKALVPMFNALADAIINVVNAFNMFFNALAGRVTFTKAKKYAVDYAESLDKAGGSAKKLKDNLLGIDELNIIMMITVLVAVVVVQIWTTARCLKKVWLIFLVGWRTLKTLF